MAKQAIRPEIFTIKGFIDTKAETEGISAEEQILAAGAGLPFWKVLKEHVENSIEQLNQINEAAIAQGMTLEEIGRNALVISQTKGVITKIFNVVDDAVETVDQHGKTE